MISVISKEISRQNGPTIFSSLFASIWVFPKMVVPPFHTPKWSFLVGKPIVVWYHHFRKFLFVTHVLHPKLGDVCIDSAQDSNEIL